MIDDDEMEMEETVEVDQADSTPEPSDDRRELVSTILSRIKADKKYHSAAFDRMRRSMRIARRGADEDWPENYYTANIIGRHLNQKVSALYAKNPKAIARRRPRLDFEIWDEDFDTLSQAMQIAAQAQATPPQIDPRSGTMLSPMVDPVVQQSVALVQDFQRGMTAREQISRLGKTLEILFAYYMAEQNPLDFKTAMKQLVRRAATTAVGYIKLGFQRELDEDPIISSRISDFSTQLRHIDGLLSDLQGDDPETDKTLAKREELKLAIESLQEQQYVLLREGLVFDFPGSTRVIPDQMCTQLTGFVGARWITVEYPYTVQEVEELFDVDLNKGGFKPYTSDGPVSDQGELDFGERKSKTSQDNLVCVWEHYDRLSGLVYYVADGHENFLREPSAPDVYVEDFWPVYALTFNEVESEDELFPPSDVELLADMQKDYNASRQGKREHREFARPRLFGRKGILDDEDKRTVGHARPFSFSELNVPEGMSPRDVMSPLEIPGVDPNLYDVGEIFTDVQLTVGAQEAQFGATAKATATESSIAEGSRIASVDSGVDDLDSFLTRITRSAGQILMQEMSSETVKGIAGPGAVWPELSLEDLVKEVYLEVEAGSSGKPNQAQEIRNWKEMLPFLIQMPTIKPEWLAKESLRRLDDRMDLTDALAENVPAIVSQNRMAQPSPGDPGAAPDQQGGEGADNGPAPPGGPVGSDAPMGNNQV